MVTAGWAAMARSMRAAQASASPDNEDYWRMVKRQFPLRDGLIYLNAANVCPASRAVMDRHLEYLRDFHADPSFQNRDKYEPLAERARAKAARLFGAAADEIAFTRNTSEGSNIIVTGVDLKAGDEIVITEQNHPSNNDSWKVRARRLGLVVKAAAVPVPPASRQELLDSIERVMSERTRVVAVTHVTNTAGALYPVIEIGELARRRGAWYHVDGAQSLGALDLNLREMGCDSYSGSMHKWPMGPLEAGLLYVKADRIAGLWPSIVTAGWSDRLKGARKFEVFGQRDNPRLVAVEAALDFLELIGMKQVEARMRALAQRAMRGLSDLPGVKLRTNPAAELSAGVVKFDLEKKDLRTVYDTLWRKHGLAIAQTASGPTKGLRFSPHVYNTMDEIDRAVAAVREVAG
jgi:selenocysteine lyase/cysteine desulfurase